MIETKLLFNSVISDEDKGARFCSMDLKDMFLHTPVDCPEYMRVPFKYFPEYIRQKYDLYNLLHSDNCIYIKIKKGMYSLKQVTILVYNNLSKLLINAGYLPIIVTLDLWSNTINKTLFYIYFDDFGVT